MWGQPPFGKIRAGSRLSRRAKLDFFFRSELHD